MSLRKQNPYSHHFLYSWSTGFAGMLACPGAARGERRTVSDDAPSPLRDQRTVSRRNIRRVGPAARASPSRSMHRGVAIPATVQPRSYLCIVLRGARMVEPSVVWWCLVEALKRRLLRQQRWQLWLLVVGLFLLCTIRPRMQSVLDAASKEPGSLLDPNPMYIPAWDAQTGAVLTAFDPQRHLLPFHFIACSSDDWGRIADSVPLFRDSHARQEFLDVASEELKRSLRQTDWSMATVETVRDLQRLHEFLLRLQEAAGEPRQRFVLSPMWVVGGPDIPAMQNQLDIKREGSTGPLRERSSDAQRWVDARVQRAAATPERRGRMRLVQRSPRERWRNSRQRLHETHAEYPQPGVGQRSTDPVGETRRAGVTLQRPDSLKRFTGQSSTWGLLTRPVIPTDAQAVHAAPTGFPYRSMYMCRLSRNGASILPGRDLIESIEVAEWYRKLWYDRVWAPQFHGSAHIHPHRWLEALERTRPLRRQRSTARTRIIRSAYDSLREGYVYAGNITALRSEFADGAWSPASLRKGMETFAGFWGYRPRVMSSPHNTWTPSFVQHLVASHAVFGIDAGTGQCATLVIPNATQRSVSCIDREPWDTFAGRAARLDARMPLIQERIAALRPGFTSLAWHAQNALSATTSPRVAAAHLEHLETFVHWVQRQNHTVFVTSNELHQIRLRGWSLEVWPDAFVYRNFLPYDILVLVPCLEDMFSGASPWEAAPLRVVRLDQRLIRAPISQSSPELTQCRPWSALMADSQHAHALPRSLRYIQRQKQKRKQLAATPAFRGCRCQRIRLPSFMDDGVLLLPGNSHWIEVRRLSHE